MNIFRGSDLGIDLGTSKFSLCVRGEGEVVSEAAYVAFRGEELTPRSLVAFGNEAKDMLGKVRSDQIKVLCPMRDGIIEDSSMAALLLQNLAKKAGIPWARGRSSTLITALMGASPLERKAFQNVAESLGRSRVVVIEEPLAAVNALDVDLSEPYAQMIVDIGEGASEAMVLCFGRRVLGRSIRVAGHSMTQSIVDYARKHYGIIISDDYARQMKELLPDMPALRGMDVGSAMPMLRHMPVRELKEILRLGAAPIVALVREVLSVLPADMSVDLIENGIHLSGGASRSYGLKDEIEFATGLHVTLLDAPEKAVIKGCSRILDYVEYVS